MITSIEIENYKVLKKAKLELSNLNLLTGVNGMGKSSLIQTLLLLRQSKIHGSLRSGNLRLNGEYFKAGKGKDVFYQYAEDPKILINLSINKDTHLDFSFKYEPIDDYLKPYNSDYSEKHNFDSISLFNNNFQYLNSEHLGPNDTFPVSVGAIQEDQIGNKGDYAAFYLTANGDAKVGFDNLKINPNENKTLIRQVSAWLNHVTPGARVEPKDTPDGNSVTLDFKFQTDKDFTNLFAAKHVGFGLTHVLPVILTLLTAKKEKLIIIENPESHLHPRAQTKIGELLFLVAQNGVQLIVETHSDHILNGIRLAIKKQKKDSDKVKIFYFDRSANSDEHYSHVVTPQIDDDGRIDLWPDGFFDEFEKSLMGL